jgi:hypothetical protein
VLEKSGEQKEVKITLRAGSCLSLPGKKTKAQSTGAVTRETENLANSARHFALP